MIRPDKANRESGNVLFLILIAVALFAALSYAVTQSSRTSGSSSSNETNLLNSAQITQYPAGLRTSVVRMIIGGADIDALQFNPPSDYGATNYITTRGVFHPDGGGATWVEPPVEFISGTNDWDGLWHFNSNFDIPNIGISGVGGTELIAFLPGIGATLCRKINSQFGIGGTQGTPPATGGDWSGSYAVSILSDASTVDGLSNVAFNDTPAFTFPASLQGQPFGCFHNDDATIDEFVYYHVLVER